jgi:hypothetical protein
MDRMTDEGVPKVQTEEEFKRWKVYAKLEQAWLPVP